MKTRAKIRRCAAPLAALCLAAGLAGCSMTPAYIRPAAPVPLLWPVGDAYLKQSEAALPPFGYTDVLRDTRLRTLIEQALANNRDLRIAAANVAAAREAYRIQRAARLPTISAGAGVSVSDGGSGGSSGSTGGTTGASNQRYSLDLGVTAFELDLFGRVAALSEAEQQRYFATEAAARAVRIALIGDIADAWASHAANAALLQIAQDTAVAAERSVTLTRARLDGGVAPRTDLRQAEQILATARGDVARQTTALAQDANRLRFLVGAEVDPALLPATVDALDSAIVAAPVGLSTDVLLRRPDVVQAEYELRAANADIGAARAALFPRLSLTGLLGLTSTALGDLLSGGAFSASASADAGYDIFRGGAGRASVRQSEAERDAALAAYERAIQNGFRETADALARQGTLADQLAADQLLVDAARDTARLTEARYRGGIDSYLTSLDAQRALYAAQRSLVATRLERAGAAVALLRALGGAT